MSQCPIFGSLLLLPNIVLEQLLDRVILYQLALSITHLYYENAHSFDRLIYRTIILNPGPYERV